jgi:hypothetical protein
VDYFQGVVTEFLRANRSTFVNTECLIQLEPGTVPAKDKHWFCDVVAVNFTERTVYLCEVTYSNTLFALLKRLKAWAENWASVKAALIRDCNIPADWKVVPWVFIPRDREKLFKKKLDDLGAFDESIAMPPPRIEFLEEVVPWKYPSWDRKLESIAEDDK